MLYLQKNVQEFANAAYHSVWGDPFCGLRIAHSPIKALDLVGEDSRLTIRKNHLKRIALKLRRHCTSNQKAGFGVIAGWAQNKNRPFSGLLMTNCGIKVNPYHLAGVGNPILYQTSAPTGSPQLTSRCRFSGVIWATISSSVNGRSAAVIATDPAFAFRTSTSPSRNPASSATVLGILTARLLPQRAICALAVITPR